MPQEHCVQPQSVISQQAHQIFYRLSKTLL